MEIDNQVNILMAELNEVQNTTKVGSAEREQKESVIFNELNRLTDQILHTPSPTPKQREVFFMLRNHALPHKEVVQLPVYPREQEGMFTKSLITPQVRVVVEQMARDLTPAASEHVQTELAEPTRDGVKTVMLGVLSNPNREQWFKDHRKKACKKCWSHVSKRLFQVLAEMTVVDIYKRVKQIEQMVQDYTLTESDALELGHVLQTAIVKVDKLVEKTSKQKTVSEKSIIQLFQIMVENINDLTMRFVTLQRLHEQLQAK